MTMSLVAAGLLIVLLGPFKADPRLMPTAIDLILVALLVWVYSSVSNALPWYAAVWHRLRSQPWLIAVCFLLASVPSVVAGRGLDMAHLWLTPKLFVLLLVVAELYPRLTKKL
jgi:hypothetical protein